MKYDGFIAVSTSGVVFECSRCADLVGTQPLMSGGKSKYITQETGQINKRSFRPKGRDFKPARNLDK